MLVIEEGRLISWENPAGEILIPDTVTTIGARALESCRNITRAILPPSVKTICDSAFEGCTGLTSVSIPASVTRIFDRVFEGCTGLRSVSIPGSMLDLDSSAFKDCTSLVGGQGTTYNASHIDKAYAHIDGGPSNPGYFTDKNASLRGDVDSDGNVTIGDVSALIDYLLNGASSGVTESSADVDLDGNVSIGDVSALTDYLLNGFWN